MVAICQGPGVTVVAEVPAAGPVPTLDDKAQNRKFFIGENTATALDMEGKKVEGSLAEHYVLKKED